MGIGLYPWSFLLKTFCFQRYLHKSLRVLECVVRLGYLADLLQLKRLSLISRTLDERNTALKPVGALMPQYRPCEIYQGYIFNHGQSEALGF
jgi:hypothetical protein